MMPTEQTSESLRIVFAGTPEFAASSLAALIDSQHQIVAVYTQPDRPAGRGRHLAASPVKQLALQHQIPVHQPQSLKNGDELEQLAALQADLMVVAAYGLILPPRVLETPKYGCVNVHASLLPRWRGAAPIQHAILAGDSETGITIMQMDAGLDTGAMLLKARCPINPDDTGSSLHDRLAALGAETLVTALADLPRLQASAESQNSDLASYAHKLEKRQACIDWHQDAALLARQVRAFNAWPVAYSELNGNRVRVWQATLSNRHSELTPGTVVGTVAEGIAVACGRGVLCLTHIQLPGAKVLPATEVLNAKHDLFAPGAQFGECA